MALSGYEIVHYDRWTPGNELVYGGVMAPSGKKVVGGGFHFVYSDNRADGVRVQINGPTNSSSSPLSSGTSDEWYASVYASGEGNLRIWAVCADA